MTRNLSILGGLALAAAFALAPATASARHYDDDCRRCGTVRSVERITYGDRHHRGHAGTIVGAIVGGALGNQVGKGDGRKAATIGGAVVGGAIGHQHDRRHSRGRDIAYRISVRSDRGRIYTYDQDRAYGLRPGDRVSLDDGEVRPLY